MTKGKGGHSMQQEFHATGKERKKLVEAISNFTQQKAEYQYTPTYAYKIDKYNVDKHGTLIAPNIPNDLITYLKGLGFKPRPAAIQLNISFNRNQFTETALTNLKQLLWAKGSLIQHALNAPSLSIKEDKETIQLTGFPKVVPEKAFAYQQFINHLVDYAKGRKRVNVQPREYDNERYSFRCFLLRLGFIGKEYKETRRILLERLSGNTAFLHPEEVN